MPPKTTHPIVLWDLMDTVVRDPFFDDVPPFFGLTLDQLVAQKHPETWAEFERGELSEADMLRRFFRDGREVDGEGLKRVMTAGYRFLPGMRGLLETLRRRGVSMYALSNYPSWVEMIDAELDLRRYMGLDFVSFRMGVRKPDPEAFVIPCKRLGVTPERCIFIDDRRKNVAAARRAGLQALHFDGDIARLSVELEATLSA